MRQIFTEREEGCSRYPTITAVLALAISMAIAPLHSQEMDPGEGPGHRWIVRGAPLGMISTGDESGVLTPPPELFPDERLQKEIGSGIGLGFELEYLVKPSVGVELAALFGDFDSELVLDTGELRLTDSEDIGFMAVSIGVNYHFTPRGRADLYAGAVAELSEYDDITYEFPAVGRSVKRSFDDDVGFGFKLGVDVPLRVGRPWVVSAAARHLRGPLDIKPVILSLGIGYRF